METHRVDACHHVVAQIGRLESACLQGGDDLLHLGIDLLQTSGVDLPLAQAHGQGTITETIQFLEKRTVGAAREARIVLVNNSQRQELRRFELGGEL